EQYRAAAAYVAGFNLVDRRVDALAAKPGDVTLNDSFGIAAADGGGGGVHSIQEKLDLGGTPALQVARVIIRDDNSGIDFVLAHGIAKLIHGREISCHAEAAAFGEHGDQLAALGSFAVIHNAQAHIGDGGAQGKAKQRQLQKRRQDQRYGQAAVVPD